MLSVSKMRLKKFSLKSIVVAVNFVKKKLKQIAQIVLKTVGTNCQSVWLTQYSFLYTIQMRLEPQKTEILPFEFWYQIGVQVIVALTGDVMIPCQVPKRP